jgi:hypothetical protein
MGDLPHMIFLASIWAIPVIVAITFHEAAHGFVARLQGDDTALRFGRVSFNPLRHVDPIGTTLLPGLLLLNSPFLFGYAKPVSVNFRALRNPRRDMVLVAAAGPAINIALAILAALAFHFIDYLPMTAAQWNAVRRNLHGRSCAFATRLTSPFDPELPFPQSAQRHAQQGAFSFPAVELPKPKRLFAVHVPWCAQLFCQCAVVLCNPQIVISSFGRGANCR